MSKDVCLIHGKELHYDMRSGFDICDECEQASGDASISMDAASTDSPTEGRAFVKRAAVLREEI